VSNGAGGKYGALRVDAMLYKCVNENAGQSPAIRTPSGGEPPFVKGGRANGAGDREQDRPRGLHRKPWERLGAS